MALFKFRSRSASRDRASDEDRIKPVQQAINLAIASAQNELAGLNRRLEETTRDAGMLIGYDENTQHPEPEKRRLADLESGIIAAQQRIAALEHQLRVLRSMQDSAARLG